MKIILFAFLAAISTLASLANAHGPEHLTTFGKLLKRNNINAASRCGSSAVFSSALKETRLRRMKLAKRDWDPTYSEIQNTTCVLNPEVTEGPYWIAGELVRQDITDNEPGIPLTLDLGLMDVTTCTPISGAYVELTHRNSPILGFYSGYTLSSLGSPSGSHSPLTDNKNFFRGAHKTNANGLVEFKTKFPGYYTGRTTHVHLKVTLNPTVNENGTITGGKTVHIGQMFFNAAIKSEVFALSPYFTGRSDAETTNEADSIYLQEASNGNNPVISLVNLGSAITDGFLGYLTLGVDPNFTAEGSTAPIYGSPPTTVTGSSGSGGGAPSGIPGGSPPSGSVPPIMGTGIPPSATAILPPASSQTTATSAVAESLAGSSIVATSNSDAGSAYTTTDPASPTTTLAGGYAESVTSTPAVSADELSLSTLSAAATTVRCKVRY
ncbi:Intradiol ring-cleavage dioxygenase [Cladochytrium replicatum]|nr:Intradiol ring-cleavage dioxygenase [Cladochytrium replicatum]